MPRAFFLLVLTLAQSLAPRPSTLQHITIDATTSAPSVSKGDTVTLFADVTPKPKVHVYAAAQFGFTPVTLILTPHPLVTKRQTKLPPAEKQPTLGLPEPVSMYRKPFRIEQLVTIASNARSGEALRIAGVVNY